MQILKKLLVILLALFVLTGCPEKKPEPVSVPEPSPAAAVTEPEETPVPTPEVTTEPEVTEEPVIIETVTDVPDEDGIYDTKDEVAAYLYTYHHLPSNYMTKKEARKKGWSGGALNQVIPGKCIGGDRYGNYEEILPVINGFYYECDIDTLKKKSRGAKRLIWSDAYDIYYTDDHYETFEQLYEGGGQ